MGGDGRESADSSVETLPITGHYLQSLYYVPSTILGTAVTVVTDKFPTPRSLCSQQGQELERDVGQNYLFTFKNVVTRPCLYTDSNHDAGRRGHGLPPGGWAGGGGPLST